MKRVYFTLLYLFILFYAFSMSAQTNKELKNITKILNSGYVKESNFHENINFDFTKKVILISVLIKGKHYTFLFDSGSPTLLSSSLIEELKISSSMSASLKDVSGTMQKKDLYVLDEMAIGSIHFMNTGCFSINLDNWSKAACKKIDGVVGANTMKECRWKIDFDNDSLFLSDTFKQNFSKAYVLHFVEGGSGSPFIKMKYGDTAIYIKFDTGDFGPLEIPGSLFLRKSPKHYATGYGVSSLGFFQKVVDTQFIAVADTVELDNDIFYNKIIKAATKENSLLGTYFMKNYDVFIDWGEHKIYLSPISGTSKTNQFKAFGINFIEENNKLIVCSIWKGSLPEKEGIKIGDQILSINGTNTENITDTENCNLTQKIKNSDEFKIVVKSSKNENKEYDIIKYNIVE